MPKITQSYNTSLNEGKFQNPVTVVILTATKCCVTTETNSEYVLFLFQINNKYITGYNWTSFGYVHSLA